MSQYDDALRDYLRTLAMGRSVMIHCPKCWGGQSKEKSCSVTRYPDGLGWLCFRDSCGARGRVTDRTSGPDEAQSLPAAFTPRPYTGPFRLPRVGDEAHTALQRIDVRPSAQLGVFSVDEYTMYFSLDDFSGRQIGGFTRRNSPQGREIRTYRTRPGPMFGYYPADGSQGGNTIWVVEDCLSAIRLAEHGEYDAVALLNTHLHDQCRREMVARYGRKAVYIIALDPGAEAAGAKIVDGLRTQDGCNAIQALLPKDIHKMSDQEFRAVVDHYASPESPEYAESWDYT